MGEGKVEAPCLNDLSAAKLEAEKENTPDKSGALVVQARLGAPDKTFRARDAAARRVVEDSTWVRRDDATLHWRFC
jgi:hypothetical protein